VGATTLTNSHVLWDQWDLAPFTGQLDTAASCAVRDANHLAGLGFSIMLPGLVSAVASIGGHADYAADAVDAVFASASRGRQELVTVIPNGTAHAAGDAAIFVRGQLDAYRTQQGSVGDVAGFAASITGDTPAVYGVVGAPLAARSSTLTGDALQLGAVGTGPNGRTERLWCGLHVTAASGTNLAVSVQSDDSSGFGSPAAVTSFSTVSAVGWQWTSVAGPITDDYFRVTATIGSGSFTFAVVLGVW